MSLQVCALFCTMFSIICTKVMKCAKLIILSVSDAYNVDFSSLLLLDPHACSCNLYPGVL